MEIILTYRGKIPAKRSNLTAIWDMRKEFHSQLIKLWGRQPFDVLKEWNETDFAKTIYGQKFIPLYGRKVGIGVSLDIKLLTGMPIQKSILEAGDLDNRIKRIIDGLRAPAQKGELLTSREQATWHCLMDDDNAVINLNASMGTFLASDDPSESFAFIRVRPVALNVNVDNISMLF